MVSPRRAGGGALSLLLCIFFVENTSQDGACRYCIGNLERPEENKGVCAEEQLPGFKRSHKVSPLLTTDGGAPVEDQSASMTAGPRGPVLLMDHVLIEEMAHFNRERIPERVVHAKGAGAFGYFEVTCPDFARFCKAKMFNRVGKKTSIAVRFSLFAIESGGADTLRDPRGFAVKFYTDEGNWDLVGNNTPVHFIRDGIKFARFARTQKRNPQTHLKDYTRYWDFMSLTPETIHQLMMTYSDRGIPDGYRHMHGFGSHTFKLVNATGHPVYCKFHFKTDQGIRNLNSSYAEKLAGSDPDYATKDLFNAIAKGDFPSWTLSVQIMTYEQAEKFRWNPFDLTKIWPQREYPLTQVGRMVLNRNPNNYFAEVESIAYAPANLIPGIEPSPDKMLQARLFTYPDAQRYRLGPNFQQIGVNCPYRTKVWNYNVDGQSRHGDNNGAAPNYYPDSYGGGRVDPRGGVKPFPVTGDVRRYNTDDEDNFSQPRVFWQRVLCDEERARLVENVVTTLSTADGPVQERAINLFSQVDLELGRRIGKGLGNANATTQLCSYAA